MNVADAPVSFTYKAFISYSHAEDSALAAAVHTALHRFARPWYRLRAMRVFRDKTSMSANPALWPWNFMQGADKTAAADAASAPAAADQAPPKTGGKTK